MKIGFSRIQYLALWLHLPMWLLAGVAIIIIGAYHKGLSVSEVEGAQMNALAATLPHMTIRQISQVKVSDI